MNEQQRLGELVQLVDGRRTTLGRPSTRTADIYQSPSRFAQEQARLLRRAPTIAALSSELPDRGSCRAIVDHGVPVLLTRAADGRARAFLNACRHRGAELAAEGTAHDCVRLRCPYHAWTYDLEGRLVGVPGQRAFFPTLDRARTGLVELPVAEWAGLIWYRLTPGEALDPAEACDPDVTEWLRNFALDRHVVAHRSRLPMAGNWKLFCEGVRESYHFGATHTDTIDRTFARDVMHVEQRMPHARITIPRRTLLGTDPDARDLSLHSETFNALFPRTTFSQGREGTLMFRVFPHSATRSTVELTTLALAHTIHRTGHWSKHHAHMCHVLEQDIARIESVQRNMSSQLLERVHFGRHEFLLGAFHDAIDAWIDDHETEAGEPNAPFERIMASGGAR